MLAQQVPKRCPNPGPRVTRQAGSRSLHRLALWSSGPLMCTTRPINHPSLLALHAFHCTPLESIKELIHSVGYYRGTLAGSIDLPGTCPTGHMAISCLAIARVGLKVVSFWLTLVSNILETIKAMEILI